MRMARPVGKAVGAHLVLFCGFCVVMLAGPVRDAFRFEPFGIELTDRSLQIQDFAGLMTFTRRAIRHGPPDGRSLYSVEHHLAAAGDLAEQPIQHAVIYGYSPTMLLVRAPLALLPSIGNAYVCWVLLGGVLVFWMTRPPRSPIGLGVVSFLTPVGAGAMFLGTTAIASTALFLALADRARRGRQTWGGSDLLGAMLLWALTAKPPLALTAGAVLIAMRRWSIVVPALVLTLVTTLMATPWLGEGWIVDYLTLVTRFNTSEADPVFAVGLAPEAMTNIRALLLVDLGWSDRIASRLVGVLWLLVIGIVATVGVRRWTPAGLWSIGILTYLVFFPHVSSHEDLHLYIVAALLGGSSATTARPSPHWLFWLLPIVFTVAPALPSPSLTRAGLLCVKIGLLLWIGFGSQGATTQEGAAAGPGWFRLRRIDATGGRGSLP